MRSRKPMLIIAVLMFTALILLVFGCAHGMKRQSVSVTGGPRVTTSSGSRHSKIRKSHAVKSTRSDLFSGITLIVITFDEPAPNPSDSFLQNHAGHQDRPPSPGWKSFRPETQTDPLKKTCGE
jgi:hypothetical protein